MHNIKEIRNDVEAFKKALNKRFIEIDVDKILSLDENTEIITDHPKSNKENYLKKKKKISQSLKINHFLKNQKR